MLTTNDLNNNNIYKESCGSLAERIDYAWAIYNANEEKVENRAQALNFLLYAFDIKEIKDINSQLITLMAERERHKEANPEYIPGKTPQHLNLSPSKLNLKQTKHYGQADDPSITLAIKKKELLDVNNHSRNIDKQHARFLESSERAKHRVVIRQGQFRKNDALFSTGNMESHGRAGFAAFTLNTNGELSVFNHMNLTDHIAHSSINKSVPVIAAGEIRIEEGILKAIKNHSGHYRPTLFNMYRLLEHFAKNGVDLAQAEVFTFTDPSRSLNNITSNEHLLGYQTPANQIYKEISQLLRENINSIGQQAKSYQKKGPLNALFKLKDTLIRSNLTTKRAELASQIECALDVFKNDIQAPMVLEQLEQKIKEIDQIITKFQEDNEQLSSQHGKEKSTGRLAKKISQFKEQIAALKAGKQSPDEEQFHSSMKNIH